MGGQGQRRDGTACSKRAPRARPARRAAASGPRDGRRSRGGRRAGCRWRREGRWWRAGATGRTGPRGHGRQGRPPHAAYCGRRRRAAARRAFTVPVPGRMLPEDDAMSNDPWPTRLPVAARRRRPLASPAPSPERRGRASNRRGGPMTTHAQELERYRAQTRKSRDVRAGREGAAARRLEQLPHLRAVPDLHRAGRRARRCGTSTAASTPTSRCASAR